MSSGAQRKRKRHDALGWVKRKSEKVSAKLFCGWRSSSRTKRWRGEEEEEEEVVEALIELRVSQEEPRNEVAPQQSPLVSGELFTRFRAPRRVHGAPAAETREATPQLRTLRPMRRGRDRERESARVCVQAHITLTV